MEINELDEGWVRRAADQLVKAVPAKSQGRQYAQILVELAEKAKAIGCAGEEAGMTSNELKHQINSEAAKEGSGWLTKKWEATLGMFEKDMKERLIRESRDAGIKHYLQPDEVQGAKNGVIYFLKALEVPPANPEDERADEEAEAGGKWLGGSVLYVLDMAPKLNWLGNLVFGKGRRLSLKVRLTLMLPLFALFMLSVLVAGGLVQAMLKARAPISMSDVALVGLVGFIVYFAHKLMDDLINLVTPKYQIAPWWATSIREASALLELDEVDREAGSAYARLKRYTTTCPICDGQVLLDDGKKQYGRRVVGKCQESPDEHVFTFDPKTRMGYPLRQRTDGYVGL